MKIKLWIFFLTTFNLGVILFSCRSDGKRENNERKYFESDRLEQENIQKFFGRHGLDLTVTHTERVDNYRIFLHEFIASEDKIREIIKILELDSITPKDFGEIYMKKNIDVDYNIHSDIGLDYLKNPSILFYKAESDNEIAQKELLVSKTYLFYDRKTKKACFQVYYKWG